MLVHQLDEIKTKQSVKNTLPTRREMDLDQWISVRDNPRQRDTERHAARAIHHLKKWEPTQNMVAMAETANGQSWKLDGHTRCWLWERGDIPQPRLLLVDVYRVRDATEAAHLYLTFDARAAADTTPDEIHGAMRANKVVFQSPLLSKGSFGGAVNNLYRIFDTSGDIRYNPERTYIAFKYFLPQLNLLDKCHPSPNRFILAVVMGALLTLKRHGAKAVDFWRRYAAGEGSRIGGDADAVQMLTEYVTITRAKAGAAGGGGVIQSRNIVERCINAVEGDLKNFIYTRAIKGVKPQRFAEYVAACKRMDGDRWDK